MKVRPVLVVALLMLPATVFAQVGRFNERMRQIYGENQQQLQQQQPQQQQQQQQQPGVVGNSSPQEAQLKAAKDDLGKAQGQLTSVTSTLKKDFDASNEYQSAQAALKSSQTEYDALKAPILEKVRATPEYLAAKTNKEKAEHDRDTLPRDGTNQDQITQAASAVMAAGGVMSKMESDALTADPTVGAAHAKVVAASTKIGELNKEFEKSIKDNPQVATARSAIDAAKVRVDTAQKNLDASRASIAQQKAAAAAQQRAQQQQQQQQQQQVQPAVQRR